MQNTHEIAPKLHWVGGNERRLQRFENLFPLRFGVAYNSYLIVDEKTDNQAVIYPIRSYC